MSDSPPTRRKFLRSVAATAAMAAAADAKGQSPATTTATEVIPPDDIAALVRLTGHDFTGDEQQMMSGDLVANREKYKSLRSRKIDPRVEPAIHFDPRLPGVAYCAESTSSLKLDDDKPIDYDGNVEKLAFATAAELSRLIHARKVTSVELTKMYLHRLDTIGRRLNAVVNLTSDLALRRAERADKELAAGKSRGPLHGLPWGAKDLLATAGIPTTCGVKVFENHVTDYDASVVRKLDDAGAVLCAKLSLGELAMGDVWFGGQTRSPWDEKTGSKGSSAGPAATVASGCVAFAIGSETMGSIVSPCVTNGVVGLRPTYGRVSRYGAMPLSRTMDKLGPIARSAQDCAMVLGAIHGPDDLDPTAVTGFGFNFDAGSDLTELKVGYDVAVFEEMAKHKDEKQRAIYADALAKLRELAGELKPIHLPDPTPYKGITGTIIAAESASSFTELVESGDVRTLVQQGPHAWPNEFRFGSLIPAADYLRAMQVRTMLMRAFHECMQGVDCYVTIPYAGSTVYMTNATGHPTVVTRAGLLNGRPVMLEFLGQHYREDTALRLAHAYEQVSGANKTWPTIS